MANKTFRTQGKALEVVFNDHHDGDAILAHYRTLTYGLYKGFVKWHKEGKPHTHVGLILRDKPDISDVYSYFTVNIDGVELKPNLVKRLGKGNGKPLNKLSKYVSYLTDGHDNGTYKDTWNYKYDHEVDICSTVVGRALCCMARGDTYEDMFKAASWDERGELAAAKKKILSAWRECERVLEPPKPVELRPWQQECLDKVKEQGDRKLLWVYDPKGNSGKTKLCKEMALHHDTAVFGNAGKKDLAYAYDGQPIVAFNLTRTTEGRVNYESMESLKDGLMFSAKYESETKVYQNPPKMLVMSNTLPDTTAMSIDRWDMYQLEEGRLSKLPSPSPQEDSPFIFLEDL